MIPASPALTVIVLGCGGAPSASTLQSLDRQTHRDEIGQTIFLECCTDDFRGAKSGILVGGGNRSFRLQREGWAEALMRVTTPFIAFVWNGDTWSDDHLGSSLATFDSDENHAATYSNFNEKDSATGPVRSARAAWRVWMSSGCDFTNSRILLDEVGTMATVMLGASLNESTLVMRTKVAGEALCMMQQLPEALDDTRLLPVFLSQRGNIGYITAPKATKDITADYVDLPEASTAANREVATTEWLFENHIEIALKAAEKFNLAAAKLPHAAPIHPAFPSLANITHGIVGAQWSALFFKCGFDLVPRERSKRNARWLLHQICPPALLEAVAKRSGRVHPYTALAKQ